MQLGFTIDVVEANALDFETDVLIIKYTERSGGLDAKVRKALTRAGITTLEDDPPRLGDYRLLNAPPNYKCRYVMSVGTVSVFSLGYAEIRDLGRDMLVGLHAAGVAITHIATTLHGVNTSLRNDEVEAFRSLLLGFADAYEAGHYPPTLARISIVESQQFRAQLMADALKHLLPQVRAAEPQQTMSEDLTRPLADDNTPHIFVAMPFAEAFDDQYYLAIRPAVTDNGVLCIRLDVDETAFAGDIMEQVKKRIQTAALVIALLDTRNPNVYLEVGYAWGVGTPALLILHEDEEPPFDVQGARLLKYNRIYRLKEQLESEVREMLKARPR